MAEWYVIRTATRQEQKVVDGLHDLARAHLISMDAYVPCETRWNHLTRVKTLKQVPMLPSYLFLRIAPEHLWRVDKIEGVYQILGWATRQSDKEALRLGAFVDELRTAEQAGAFDRTKGQDGVRVQIKRGEKVRVSGGQFSGFVGEILEAKGKDRVRVLLAMFGRLLPVPIRLEHLAPQEVVSKDAA